MLNGPLIRLLSSHTEAEDGGDMDIDTAILDAAEAPRKHEPAPRKVEADVDEELLGLLGDADDERPPPADAAPTEPGWYAARDWRAFRVHYDSSRESAPGRPVAPVRAPLPDGTIALVLAVNHPDMAELVRWLEEEQLALLRAIPGWVRSRVFLDGRRLDGDAGSQPAAGARPRPRTPRGQAGSRDADRDRGRRRAA